MRSNCALQAPYPAGSVWLMLGDGRGAVGAVGPKFAAKFISIKMPTKHNVT